MSNLTVYPEMCRINYDISSLIFIYSYLTLKLQIKSTYNYLKAIKLSKKRRHL